MDKRNIAIAAGSIIVAMLIAAIALLSVPVAVIVGMTLIAGAFILIKPINGIILYLILIVIRPQDFIPVLARMRIMLILAVAILLLLLMRHAIRKEALSSFGTRQQILMFLFLLIIPLSDLSNLRVGDAWQSFDDFLTLYLFFLIIVLGAQEKYAVLYWALALSSVALAANGIIQHTRGYDLIGQESLSGRVRWVGIFGDPNDFALLLVSAIPLLLFTLFKKHLFFALRIVLAIFLLILVAGLYFTESRGGQVALMTVLLAFALKRWGIRKGLILGAVFGVAALVLAPGRMTEVSPYGQSESGRIYAWLDGLIALKSHPLLGIGYMKFTEYHGRAPHSAFIMCMAELGLLGYFVWLALIYVSFKTFITAERLLPGSDEARYSAVAQVSTLGFLSSAYFLSQTYSPVIYFLFAIAALVASAIVRATGVKSPFLTAREAGIILAIEAGSIISYKGIAAFY